MKIELHSWTSPHPYVKQLTTLTDRYNHPTTTWPLVNWLVQPDHPAYADMLIEFAGRLCYRSEDKMGKSPNFIGARVNEGHEDILEHVSITVLITDTIANSADHRFVHGIGEIERAIRRWESISKFVYPNMIEPREWYVTANARVWRELCQYSPHIPLAEVLYPVAPQVFKDLLPTPGKPSPWNSDEVLSDNQHVLTEKRRPEKDLFDTLYHVHPKLEDRIPVALAHDATGIKVTHLGTNIPLISKTKVTERHATTTFLVEHVSRACTHQLVRHRRASFSQESQRYVDLEKGDWDYIMPPSIAINNTTAMMWNEHMEGLAGLYGDLRSMGVRKEDARFILPNAAETRLIVTMPHDAWLHFCWLRALDKAAQWEIRALGQLILQFLKTIQPDAFYPLWLNLLDNRERLEVTFD